jgi:hypothetical protein
MNLQRQYGGPVHQVDWLFHRVAGTHARIAPLHLHAHVTPLHLLFKIFQSQ